jgi:hypothetical protein
MPTLQNISKKLEKIIRIIAQTQIVPLEKVGTLWEKGEELLLQKKQESEVEKELRKLVESARQI